MMGTLKSFITSSDTNNQTSLPWFQCVPAKVRKMVGSYRWLSSILELMSSHTTLDQPDFPIGCLFPVFFRGCTFHSSHITRPIPHIYIPWCCIVWLPRYPMHEPMQWNVYGTQKSFSEVSDPRVIQSQTTGPFSASLLATAV